MISRIDKTWTDCDFNGVIKVYDITPKKAQEPIEIIDDYDVRHKFGSKVHMVRSRFDKEEF